MKNLTRFMLAVSVLIGVEAGTLSLAQAAPPTWSFARASFGVDAKGGIFDGTGPTTSAFLPGAYLSYSATSQMSLAGTFERDFPRHLSIGQTGLRFLMLKSERGQVAAGVNAVFYGDEGASSYTKPTSWNASVNGSWAAAKAKDGRTVCWGIASAAYDPDNALTILRIGLRLQILGGNPIYPQGAEQ